MAGVPLLNGFLSKEMFFAETIAYHGRFRAGRSAALYRHGRRRCSASPTRCGSSTAGCSAHRPPICRRMPPPLPSSMVLPVALLVSVRLLVGIFPAATAGPPLALAVGAVLGLKCLPTA